MCDRDDENILIGPDLNVSKAALDKKLYRQFILKKNGLRVLLISDTLALGQKDFYDDYYSDEEDEDDDDLSMEEEKKKESSDEEDEEEDEEEEEEGLRKASAALVVGAGSFHDPPYAMGMAHFLEHMLFMGTKKYPNENAYDSFITNNGGSNNAYTELEYTAYNFDIPQEKLFQVLDMFAQFFVDPLLLPDAVDRELNAIESEFQLAKNSDSCRVQQLLFHTSGREKKDHPFGTFSWGNLNSLKEMPEKNNIDMLKELRKFYDQYYYASNMSLVVIGGYTLDELQKKVVQYFSDVPAEPRVTSPLATKFQKSNQYPRTWNEMTIRSPIKDFGMPLAASSLGKIYRIIPVKDRHSLSITWQLPPQQENWRSKPFDYIANLLGHEGQGSLFSALKKKSWVTSCFAGMGSEGYEYASSHGLFTMSFTLSEEGVNHWSEIIHFTYSYIGMIRFYCNSPDGLPPWLYEELRAVQEVSYKFADEQTPGDLVDDMICDLAPSRSLPPERLLDGYSLVFEFDPDSIKRILDEYMTPWNARVDLMSATFGRASDFDDSMSESDDGHGMGCHSGDALMFSKEKLDAPFTVPEFGAKYWCHMISPELLKRWEEAASPTSPSEELELNLPAMNPFVPTEFGLKPLPPDDSHHPLLHCSLKLCISVGKKKAWFPATVMKYNSTTNSVLMLYEDHDEKWHKVDFGPDDENVSPIHSDFESTFDNKSVKFKVISVPKDGEGHVMKFGDDSDLDVEAGEHFPPIPPPLPESRLPRLIMDNQLLKLWWLQDRKFRRPTAELRLMIISPHVNKNPLSRACAELMVLLWKDAVTEVSYQASIAELGSSMSVSDAGFTLRVHGFEHKLLYLAKEILNVLFSFAGRAGPDGLPSSIKEGRFEACLESLRRRYNNSGMQASSMSVNVRIECIRNTSWSSWSKMKSLEEIDVASFLTHTTPMLEKVTVEALYHGNCDRSDADAASMLITDALKSHKILGLPKKKHPSQLVLKVPSTTENEVISIPSKDKSDPNTSVEVYFQVGPDNIGEKVLTDLLAHIMSEPLFDQVRTKDQFGYQVSVGAKWTNGVMGMCFKIVTASKTAGEAQDRLEKFLVDFREELSSMKNEDFMENLIGLAKTKLEMYNSLEEECSDLWSEILDCRYDWQCHRNEAAQLRTVTKQDVLDAYDKWLIPRCSKGNLQNRRRFTVVVQGAGEERESDSSEEIGNIIDKHVKLFHHFTGHETWGKIVYKN